MAASSNRRLLYEYTPLHSLPSCGKINVYGVVRLANIARPTCSGNSYYKTIVLETEALYNKGSRFTVTIFSKLLSKLPECDVFDVIRLHRMQVEDFCGEKNGKLRLDYGGAFVLFRYNERELVVKSSSASNIILTEEDKALMTQMGGWVSAALADCQLIQVESQDGAGAASVTGAVSVTGAADAAADTGSAVNTVARAESRASTEQTGKSSTASCIRDLSLNSYLNISCQLLKVSVLKANEHRLAILTVWDGTRCKLSLNRPDESDCNSLSHECGVLEQLADYCVNIIVYGAHVHRAKNLRLGALYTFYGVHCKLPSTINKPELYLHESFRKLALPLTDPQERDSLIGQLKVAADGNTQLDITPDDRAPADLLKTNIERTWNSWQLFLKVFPDQNNLRARVANTNISHSPSANQSSSQIEASNRGLSIRLESHGNLSRTNRVQQNSSHKSANQNSPHLTSTNQDSVGTLHGNLCSAGTLHNFNQNSSSMVNDENVARNDAATINKPSHDSCIPSHDSCIPSHDSCIPSHDSCIPSHDSCIPSHDSCIPSTSRKRVSTAATLGENSTNQHESEEGALCKRRKKVHLIPKELLYTAPPNPFTESSKWSRTHMMSKQMPQVYSSMLPSCLRVNQRRELAEVVTSEEIELLSNKSSSCNIRENSGSSYKPKRSTRTLKDRLERWRCQVSLLTGDARELSPHTAIRPPNYQEILSSIDNSSHFLPLLNTINIKRQNLNLCIDEGVISPEESMELLLSNVRNEWLRC